jgi:hypothetical protein
MKKSLSELGREAERLAAEINEAGEGAAADGGAHQGSAHRKLPESLRQRFLELRTELFRRGVYDPVLVRFDSATSTQADTPRIAEQLAAFAESIK